MNLTHAKLTIEKLANALAGSGDNNAIKLLSGMKKASGATKAIKKTDMLNARKNKKGEIKNNFENILNSPSAIQVFDSLDNE